MDGLNFKGDIRMIELNKGQKIAGYIFAILIALISLALFSGASIIGFAISAGLVIWCLYKKSK